MQVTHRAPFARGYDEILGRKGPHANMLMDFGVLSLGAGEEWRSGKADEKALLLAAGDAELAWPGGTARVSRGSLFDESPTVLHLPEGAEATIRAGDRGAEVYVMRTENPAAFSARLYLPEACRSEERGKGTMREASTRIVRTVFDDRDEPEAKFVLGEVVGLPGKWSSYPPHHHPQPEIYHYRFLPAQGFGFTAIGERPFILKDRDTICIADGLDHPQVTAPGYAMWYLWVIRHLDGNRYRAPWPAFTEEHAWVQSPGAGIWEPKQGR